MEPRQSRLLAVEDAGFYPASPSSEFIHSSVLSLCVLVVFESEIPIDDSETMTLLKKDFLPVNPRFSSLLLKDEKGKQKWKRVEVTLQDHVIVPTFPVGLEPDAYDGCFKEYLSKIFMEKLPEDRPLWEIHLFKYPTRDAAGIAVFKLHHAIGDGFSLMGALFSCLKRADDPSLPLNFPAASVKECQLRGNGVVRLWRGVCGAMGGCWNTSFDFCRSVLMSTVMVDDRSAIRSGTMDVEKEPVSISTVTLSLDIIRQIKSNIGGTVNDVAVGTIFYAIQLYKQRTSQNSSGTRMTALVLLNTRMLSGYQSLNDMLRQNTWGNHFTFLHVGIPSCKDAEKADPLAFIYKARKTIKRKKNSFAVVLTGRLLQMLRSIRGPEAASRFIRGTLENTSTAISHLIGPMEKMDLGNHPVKSFYFTVAGAPQSIGLTMVSYHGNLRLSVAGEKGFIDSELLTSCVKEAFDKIYTVACGKNGIKQR